MLPQAAPAVTKTVNRLTQVQQYALFKAIENHTLVVGDTREALAKEFAASLGFHLTAANIDSALEVVGKAIPGKKLEGDAAMAVLIKQIVDICHLTGSSCNPEFLSLVNQYYK